jgi:hypothetical protein
MTFPTVAISNDPDRSSIITHGPRPRKPSLPAMWNQGTHLSNPTPTGGATRAGRAAAVRSKAAQVG